LVGESVDRRAVYWVGQLAAQSVVYWVGQLAAKSVVKTAAMVERLVDLMADH